LKLAHSAIRSIRSALTLQNQAPGRGFERGSHKRPRPILVPKGPCCVGHKRGNDERPLFTGSATDTKPSQRAIQSRMSVLLKFDVPTFYVSKDFLLAALRTELPQDMLLEGIPFPFAGTVFMFPKGLVCHQEEGDCPYIAFSKHKKGDRHDLPISELSCPTVAPRDMVIASTYTPEAKLNVNYFKKRSHSCRQNDH
jgi:hypothetical protein